MAAQHAQRPLLACSCECGRRVGGRWAGRVPHLLDALRRGICFVLVHMDTLRSTVQNQKKNRLRLLSRKLMELLYLRARGAAVVGECGCAVQTVCGASVRLLCTLVDVRELEDFHAAQPAKAAAEKAHGVQHAAGGLRASHARRCRLGDWS